MKNKLNLIAAIFVFLIFSSFASAQSVVVPLNTGYDHALAAAYNVPTTGVAAPTSTTPFAQDDYWMFLSDSVNNIWSPSFAIQKNLGWLGPLTTPVNRSNWISSRKNWLSAPGVNQNNPGYTLYKKCFCLQKGFIGPGLRFQLRADDNVTVWFNTMLNTVVPSSLGNHGGNPVTHPPITGYKVGSNCIYVLVEDYYGVATGFDLNGTVSATAGLLPTPAKGPNMSYAPCSCSASGLALDPSIKDDTRRLAKEDDDSEVVKAIIKFAEERRLQRMKDTPKQK